MNIYDIAEKAGVSASTVSRVINNKPGIKAETKEKIRRLLKKYNYSPNESARGLVNRSSRTIGIIIPDIRDVNHITCAFTAQTELAAGDYCCFILNTGEEEENIISHMRLLRQRQVDGAVTIGSFYQRPMVEEKIREFLPDIPIVMANGGLDLPNVYSVMMDEITAVHNMVNLLWERGRRKFAFVGAEKRVASNVRKLEGFTRAMAAHGERKNLWLYRCENTLQGGYDVASRIIDEHPNVDVIMFSWDIEATGALRFLVDRGIRIPDQVAVTGFDNTIYCELCYPKLSSIDVKPREMCITAARTLLEQLSGLESIRTLVIPPSFVEREST